MKQTLFLERKKRLFWGTSERPWITPRLNSEKIITAKIQFLKTLKPISSYVKNSRINKKRWCDEEYMLEIDLWGGACYITYVSREISAREVPHYKITNGSGINLGKTDLELLGQVDRWGDAGVPGDYDRRDWERCNLVPLFWGFFLFLFLSHV